MAKVLRTEMKGLESSYCLQEWRPGRANEDETKRLRSADGAFNPALQRGPSDIRLKTINRDYYRGAARVSDIGVHPSLRPVPVPGMWGPTPARANVDLGALIPAPHSGLGTVEDRSDVGQRSLYSRRSQLSSTAQEKPSPVPSLSATSGWLPQSAVPSVQDFGFTLFSLFQCRVEARH